MFKKIKWGAYAPFALVKKDDLIMLEKILQLCFPNCKIDKESRRAKDLLAVDVITLNDGQDVEEHNWHDLVFNKIPYVVFSNNWHFIKGVRQGMLQTADPIYTLQRSIERYYHTIKNQKDFHL